MTDREEQALKLLNRARERHSQTVLWRNTLEYEGKYTVTQQLRILQSLHRDQREIVAAIAILRRERSKRGKDSSR